METPTEQDQSWPIIQTAIQALKQLGLSDEEIHERLKHAKEEPRPQPSLHFLSVEEADTLRNWVKVLENQCASLRILVKECIAESTSISRQAELTRALECIDEVYPVADESEGGEKQ